MKKALGITLRTSYAVDKSVSASPTGFSRALSMSFNRCRRQILSGPVVASSCCLQTLGQQEHSFSMASLILLFLSLSSDHLRLS